MMELDTIPETRVLVDEILHSIFFLGNLRDPTFSPQTFLSDDILTELKDRYPRPFTHYSTQLPRRSPFSCVLDMFVHLCGKEEEDKIKDSLRELFNEMGQTCEKRPLSSSTICISQTSDPGRYYGVSMSTSGRNPGQIMVAASCLKSWHSYVAGAVMTFYPDIQNDFDGTIKLPERVRCQTFSLSNGREMPPCGACGNLFGLGRVEDKSWAYGNCAEVESVSNLIKNVETVREEARPKSEKCTEEKREMAEERVKKKLITLLKLVENTKLAKLAKQLQCGKIKFTDLFYDPYISERRSD
ncbi:uncharacterized protein LOC131984734 [Centropristis striata]|uniref:uncharacterized protein LOC131984734 n=1 Tax=Centropristis striata TaxID=184440 RepID=UPI0027E1465C|nr:uncharacterized protein LOC131984734 [Centropristis striata]